MVPRALPEAVVGSFAVATVISSGKALVSFSATDEFTTVITAKVPAGTAGVAVVEVANTDGLKATLTTGFIYIAGSTAPGPGKITSGTVAPNGVGLIVFAGGSNQQLIDAALAGGCSTSAKLAFFAADGKGNLVTDVPVAQIAIVNTAWNTRFKTGVPAQEPLIVPCW